MSVLQESTSKFIKLISGNTENIFFDKLRFKQIAKLQI